MVPFLPRLNFEIVVLIAVLVIAMVAHGYNMLNYPYLENDEGTYMAQAWSLSTQSKLAPYTYWYDHAPLGWVFIALWSACTGGFFHFGLAVNSGRVLMLVIHVTSAFVVYLITKRITHHILASVLAVLFFSLTPLGIYYQRRVLLDNLMVFWTLLSLYLLLGSRHKLSDYILSAVFFATAVLTKESAIYFFPAFVYIVFVQAQSANRSFAVFKWIAIASLLISFYPLYALLKGEFFPTGTFLGGSNPHVSLVETLAYQLSRSGEGGVFSPFGAFQTNLFHMWLTKDPLLIIAGAIATILGQLLSFKNKSLRFITFPTVLYWFFLMRGGIVIEFYIVPLIPLISMMIALCIHQLMTLFVDSRLGKIINLLAFCLVLLVMFVFYAPRMAVYTVDQTSHQREAITWIRSHVPVDAILLIDNYAFVDLRSRIPGSIFVQKGAQYYWKADKDPEVKINILQNDWENIDYILFSDQMHYDIYHTDLDIVRQAYENSIPLQTYTGHGYDIEIRKVISSRTH